MESCFIVMAPTELGLTPKIIIIIKQHTSVTSVDQNFKLIILLSETYYGRILIEIVVFIGFEKYKKVY